MARHRYESVKQAHQVKGNQPSYSFPWSNNEGILNAVV